MILSKPKVHIATAIGVRQFDTSKADAHLTRNTARRLECCRGLDERRSRRLPEIAVRWGRAQAARKGIDAVAVGYGLTDGGNCMGRGFEAG